MHRRHLPLRPLLSTPGALPSCSATATASSAMHWFFLQGAPATYEATGVAFLAFWLFQFAFADTCSTITSGAMIGRTGFVGDLLYSFGVSGFIYPIIGHWAWGPDGFLATMGSAGNFLPSLGHELPRFRRLHRRAHHRRLHRAGRRHRPRPAPRPQVQARRRRPDAAARSDDRGPAAVCSSGSAGTASIPAARFRRWTSRASAASPPTPRWPPARRV